MADRPRGAPPLPLYVVLAEAALAATIVVAGAWLDRESRPRGPESPLFAYVAAIRREDLEEALDQLVPAARADAEPFVAWEMGNRYTVLESAVRTGSLLDRLAGGETPRTRLVVSMEIESKGMGSWRANEELPVERIGDRWYLQKPPLQVPSR